MPLVTLEQANLRLRLDIASGDPRIPDVELALSQATDLALKYANRQPSPIWDETTVPGGVSSAILAIAKALLDDQDKAEMLRGLACWDISNPVVGMLTPYHAEGFA